MFPIMVPSCEKKLAVNSLTNIRLWNTFIGIDPFYFRAVRSIFIIEDIGRIEKRRANDPLLQPEA
ncbi:hypothetical protein YDYSY3_35080 [Paenibacillus chitinolyticus]|nr:hypothetical protein YDYSY3_35080 [Paenibacillus chitinolyticus]